MTQDCRFVEILVVGDVGCVASGSHGAGAGFAQILVVV